MATRKERIEEALAILIDLELPRGQQNERSALCLLALLNLRPEKSWKQASAPLMGITYHGLAAGSLQQDLRTKHS